MPKLKQYGLISVVGGTIAFAGASLIPSMEDSISGRLRDGQAPISGSCSAADWPADAFYQPPALREPVKIHLQEDEHRRLWEPPGVAAGTPELDIHPRNYVYDLGRLDPATDYVVTADFQLTHPLVFSGGRQVRLIGLDIKPVVAANGLPDRWGGIGTVRQTEAEEGQNQKPRIPLSAVLTGSSVHTLVIEGSVLDANETNSDVVVTNISDRYGPLNSEASFLGAKDTVNFYVLNSRLIGGQSSERIHADIWHHQNSTFNTLRMRNVTMETPAQGLTFQGENANMLAGKGAYLSRVEWLPGNHDIVSGAGGASVLMIEDGKQIATDPVFRNWDEVYLGGPWPKDRFRNIRIASIDAWAKDDLVKDRVAMIGLHAGRPPDGPFAPRERIGLNYGQQTCYE